MAKNEIMEETGAKKGKSKGAKGAPKPRKNRGRTINRRRERVLRKLATKLAKVEALDLDRNEKHRRMGNIKAEIDTITEARKREIAKVVRK
jgi:hypothetical protein